MDILGLLAVIAWVFILGFALFLGVSLAIVTLDWTAFRLHATLLSVTEDKAFGPLRRWRERRFIAQLREEHPEDWVDFLFDADWEDEE